MKTNKNLFAVLLVVLFVLSGLGLVSAQDAVNLVMWSQDLDVDPIIADLFEEWSAEFSPGSTLEIQNIETEELRNQLLTAGLAGSGLPDLVLGPNDPIGVFVDAGLVQALDDQFDMSLYNGTLAAAQLGGATYGIPISSGNHLMLMYNKSLVAEAPETFEELVEVANSFAGTDIHGFAYNLNEPFWFLPFVGGFGGQVFDEDGNFVMDTEAWEMAYQFVHDLKFVEGAVPTECNYDCADGLFKEGSAAIILNGDWVIGTYSDLEQSPGVGAENLGIAPWPLLPDGGRPTPYTAGKFISIPVTVEGANLDTAVAFLTWLSTDTDAVLASTVAIGRLPALLSAYDSPAVADDPVLSASAAALATGIGMPANIELRCMWDAVRPSLEGVMADAIDAAAATADAQDAAETCVEDLG